MKTRVLSLHVRNIIRGAALLCILAPLALAQARSAPAPNSAEVLAQQSPERAPATPVPAHAIESPGGNLDFPVLRTIGGFALVISLILIVFLVARKIAPQYFNKRSTEKNLRVIESMSMGEKRSIALIQIGERRFLVGNTPHQITLLSQLTDLPLLVSKAEKVRATEPAPKKLGAPFRRFYETERDRSVVKVGKENVIPPDVRAKMRQLREALEG
jgi:flagellar biosynthetic protein FliO